MAVDFEFVGAGDPEPGGEAEGASSAASEPSYKGDLLEQHNLRELYESLVVQTKWNPPRKVGKADFFVYNNIAGDGHLRADPGAEAAGSKYDLAPLAEVRKAQEPLKLRPLGAKAVKEALPLKPGTFELEKVEIGVAIHKRDLKDRGKKRKGMAAEATRSYHSKETGTTRMT